MEKSINVLKKLASALDRRDEIPNQELAKEIVEFANKKAIKELVINLDSKNRAIQNDCIKVLYEVGALQPNLIAGYSAVFLALLTHKNNRLQWGAMTALNCISTVKPKEVYKALPQILDAADKGSVITRDHAVNILINLTVVPRFSKNAFNLLIELLLKSPVNQLPMYAERIAPTITTQNGKIFISTLQSRLNDIEKESARKRIEKVIKKLVTKSKSK